MYRSITVRVQDLDDAARDTLRGELAGLIDAIFEGPSAGHMAELVTRPVPGDAFLCRVYTTDGVLAGFHYALFMEVELRGQTTRVMRAFSGMLPAHRGGQRALPFYVRSALRVLLTRRPLPTYCFVPAVHISSYRVLAQHVPVIFPHPEHQDDPHLESVQQALADALACERVEGGHRWICRRPLWTRRSPAPARRRGTTGDSLDRFWEGLIPDMERGHCLMVVMPVNLKNLALTPLRHLRTHIDRMRGLTPPRRLAQG